MITLNEIKPWYPWTGTGFTFNFHHYYHEEDDDGDDDEIHSWIEKEEKE